MATKIKAGAHAWRSQIDPHVDLGIVPSQLLDDFVLVGQRENGYAEITSPLWPKNQKPFWVKVGDLLSVEQPDPGEPQPAPYLEPITLVMPDGRKARTLGDKIPMEWLL